MKVPQSSWKIVAMAGAVAALGCGNGNSSTSNAGGSSGTGAGGSGNAAGNSGGSGVSGASGSSDGGSGGPNQSGNSSGGMAIDSGASGGGGGDGGSSDALSLVDGGDSADGVSPGAAHLPLVLVADVDLPGGATRLDYQDTDLGRGYLIIAHTGDNAVQIVQLSDGSPVKELMGTTFARGIAVGTNVGRIFVTTTPPNALVVIDDTALTEVGRIPTGNGPNGVGWDPVDKIVGVSDQYEGAISLITNAESGIPAQTVSKKVTLGTDVGNVVYDAPRAVFWITVNTANPPGQLVSVDPVGAVVKTRINLPGCNRSHGLRLHPDGASAFVACGNNSLLVRVDLATSTIVGSSPTGTTPDVMSIDPVLGWLYVGADGADDLTVFDINKPGVLLIGHDQPGTASHTVSVDPATHRVFFPLQAGPKGTPVLRIMKPTGT